MKKIMIFASLLSVLPSFALADSVENAARSVFSGEPTVSVEPEQTKVAEYDILYLGEGKAFFIEQRKVRDISVRPEFQKWKISRIAIDGTPDSFSLVSVIGKPVPAKSVVVKEARTADRVISATYLGNGSFSTVVNGKTVKRFINHSGIEKLAPGTKFEMEIIGTDSSFSVLSFKAVGK